MLTINKLSPDVQDALDYLETGGLGEVYGMADMSHKIGEPKVQMDTSMALALCVMAVRDQQRAVEVDSIAAA